MNWKKYVYNKLLAIYLWVHENSKNLNCTIQTAQKSWSYKIALCATQHGNITALLSKHDKHSRGSSRALLEHCRWTPITSYFASWDTIERHTNCPQATAFTTVATKRCSTFYRSNSNGPVDVINVMCAAISCYKINRHHWYDFNKESQV